MKTCCRWVCLAERQNKKKIKCYFELALNTEQIFAKVYKIEAYVNGCLKNDLDQRNLEMPNMLMHQIF